MSLANWKDRVFVSASKAPFAAAVIGKILLFNPMFLFTNEILSKSYYDSNHLINLENVKKLLNLHKQKYFNPYLIWNILNFQIFLKQNKF